MKIMTILGTRPEIIRLSRVIWLLDKYASKHILVHTGQNFDNQLSDIFFDELNIRPPDVYLGVRGRSFGEQIGQILTKSEALFQEHHPDRVLILGDTNSGLVAIIARRLGIPVCHMEAGNRCFDDRVPEEVNRRVIDHSSSVLMPYTNRSKENLVCEGIAPARIHVIGNPIKEVIEFYNTQILASDILSQFSVEPRKYFLVTMHRSENVDIESKLRNYVKAFSLLYQRYGYPVICSMHPRTADKIKKFGVSIDIAGLHFPEPLGFFDFIKIEKNAFCVLSDSGTVQEECCIYKIPNVTIRDVTERPETIDCGSNILTGDNPEQILEAVDIVTNHQPNWTPPYEYLADNVAPTAVRIILGFRVPDLAEITWRTDSISND